MYNKEQYVARAVESVLRQEGSATVENGCVELIVVDDGSLDSSYEAAKGAIGGCEGCRILRRENGGVAGEVSVFFGCRRLVGAHFPSTY